MVDVKKIATYVIRRYKEEIGEGIKEKMLHLMLYLIQRECIVITGEPMFEAEFRARKWGAFIQVVHDALEAGEINTAEESHLEGKYEDVIDVVFREYSHKMLSSFQCQCCTDLAWVRAREGYGKYEDSDVPMKLEDFYEDAEQIKKWRESLPVRRLMHEFILQHPGLRPLPVISV